MGALFLLDFTTSKMTLYLDQGLSVMFTLRLFYVSGATI